MAIGPSPEDHRLWLEVWTVYFHNSVLVEVVGSSGGWKSATYEKAETAGYRLLEMDA